MMAGEDEIQWARRVEPDKIRRLYTLDAKGILDEELIDEVGYAFFARCESIKTVTEASTGKVKCPRCGELIRRVRNREAQMKDRVLECDCGWEATWGAYLKSYQRKQLHGGAAFPFFLDFLESWPKQRTPRDKLLEIDRLVHALHVNVIEAKEITFARAAAVNVRNNAEHWRDIRDQANATIARRFGPKKD
jgi:predicted RNA-binding Zn-ribbon protein involved in translation (DUF1610 family)